MELRSLSSFLTDPCTTVCVCLCVCVCVCVCRRYGNPSLFGSLGGAGATGLLRVANHAWLRIGLFGGGFGLELDNRALARAYLGPLQVCAWRGGASCSLHTDPQGAPQEPPDPQGAPQEPPHGTLQLMSFAERFWWILPRPLSLSLSL